MRDEPWELGAELARLRRDIELAGTDPTVDKHLREVDAVLRLKRGCRRRA
jgi:hypothetical protein